MNRTGRKPYASLALLSLMLTACASTVANQEPAPESDAPPAPAAREATPTAATDADALTPAERGDAEPPVPDPEDAVAEKVWAAEIFGTEGDMEKAASEYLAAALLSEDPAIARRATEVAVSARSWQIASMAADRWVLLQPDSLEARETATRTLLVGGDYALAELQLLELLQLLKDQPWGGWNRLGRLLLSGRDMERAVTMVDRLVEETGAEENPYARYSKSQVVARTGRFDDAMALAEEAVELAPQESQLLTWAGRVAMNQRDEEKALIYYEAAWKTQPSDRALALLYAELLRQTGNADQANDVLESLPDNPENRFTRIAFATESGNRALALSLFEEFDTMPYGDPVEKAFQAARSAEVLDLKEEAIRWHEQLEGTDRGLLSTLRRAYLLSELGRLDEARQVLLFARNTGGATVKLETMLVEAQILVEADQPDEAFGVLATALEQFPDNARLLYTRALIAVELDRIEEAEADLRLVLSREPANAAALNALGYTLADRTDRLEEAQELVRKAFELEPDDAAIIDSMGWVAYRMGRFDEAQRFLEQAFLRDRNAEIAAHLGEVLWVQGDEVRARRIWNEGMRIDPGNRVLVDTMKRFGVRP